MGADGVLLVCPYYNKPTQAGLEAHFRAVMAECALPAMLYNVPGRTVTDLAAETVAKLADVSGIVAIKEASGNVLRTQHVLAAAGDRFSVLSGDDALTLGIMACGGKGVVSVASNIAPAEVAEVVHRMRDGDLNGARALQLRLLPLFDALFCETNPGPVKHVLAKAGHIANEIRLPLVWPLEASQARIDAAVAAAGVTP
jgi:4-hydroxy-tetrahydrodipicolinate synthase